MKPFYVSTDLVIYISLPPSTCSRVVDQHTVMRIDYADRYKRWGELSHDQLYYTLSVLELCFWVVCLGLIIDRHSGLLSRYILLPSSTFAADSHTIPAI